MNKNNFKHINLFRGYGRLKEESLYPRVGIIKNFNIIAELEEENKQLKENWDKLKDFIVLGPRTRSIVVLIDKMRELEKGEENVR